MCYLLSKFTGVEERVVVRSVLKLRVSYPSVRKHIGGYWWLLFWRSKKDEPPFTTHNICQAWFELIDTNWMSQAASSILSWEGFVSHFLRWPYNSLCVAIHNNLHVRSLIPQRVPRQPPFGLFRHCRVEQTI